MDRISHFRFWCQKVLPLVYDNSLSYYEVLCKLADGFNKLLDLETQNAADIDSLQAAIAVLREEMDNLLAGNLAQLTGIIENAIKNVWFGLTQDGYFVAYVPESWNDVQFATTGLDIVVPTVPEYGHLVVRY